PTIALAQAYTESRLNPNAVSGAGAQGLWQFIPGTWQRFGSGSPFDPVAATSAWCRYMSYLLNLFNRNISLALAGYNAGEGNVRKYGGIPPFAETRNYVSMILAGAPGWLSTVSGIRGLPQIPLQPPDSGSGLPSEPSSDTGSTETIMQP